MSLLSVAGFAGCEVCPLDKEARYLKHAKMKPIGDYRPDLYILGGSPSEGDDEAGEPFAGESGLLITDVLQRIVSSNTRIRWSNIVRCHPKENTQLAPVVNACSIYTTEDLLSNPPKVLILAGSAALRWATSESHANAWRGIPIPMRVGNHRFWAVPILDLAYILKRGGADDRNPAYSLLCRDLEFAVRLIGTEPPDLNYAPQQFRDRVQVVPKLGPLELDTWLDSPTVGIDLETDGLDPWRSKHGILTCSIATPNISIAFPINHPQAQQPQNRAMLETFLKSYKGQIVAHHAGFELSWLLKEFGAEVVLAGAEWHDSMCGMRTILDRESPLALDDGCRIFLGCRIKELTGVDATKWFMYTPDQLLTYNGVDSIACLTLAERLALFNLGGDAGLEYRRLREAVIATSLMSHSGFPLNIAKDQEIVHEVYGKISDVTQKLGGMPDVVDWARKQGKPFNPSDEKHVANFFEGLGLLQPESGVSEPVLSEIRHSAVDHIIEVRRYEKLLNTYLEPWPKLVGTDGRLHPRITVCRVATGRLSYEDPNLQNVPKRKDKRIRECFEPPNGMEIVALDYSQLEIRILAMLSGDPVLVDELWSKEDLHASWMNRVIELYPEVLERVSEEYAEDDEKKIRKALRDEIKTGITFALPYGASREKPAQVLKLPREVGYQIADEHRRHYPRIYQWQNEQRNLYHKQGYIVIASTRRRRTGLLEGNEPLNTPIQGTGSDIVTTAMTRLAKRALRENDPALLPRLNIHDDLTHFVPTGQYLQYGKVIGEEMVRVLHPMINVPIEVEASHGPDWYHQETFAVHSSTDYGHRRARGGRPSAVSQVSPDTLFGGAWSAVHGSCVGEAAPQQVMPSRLVTRRPLRSR
ncbi:MAG: DNA polymerase [Bryobacteraceae bacterium]